MTARGQGPGSGCALGVGLILCLLGSGSSAQPAGEADGLDAAARAAVFKAAGAVQRKGKWVLCVDDPATPGASIAQVMDLNGDGRPEAVVTEDGTFCHGHAGTGFKLLSRQGDGSWRVMTGGSGMPLFLATRGAGGWPDVVIGGPGFCFPVERWNGKTYALHRFEYEGKRCKPPR
ncbi:MAG: hypothetical protein ACLGG6_02690 [Gammaproteobacteria bacterium]